MGPIGDDETLMPAKAGAGAEFLARGRDAATSGAHSWVARSGERLRAPPAEPRVCGLGPPADGLRLVPKGALPPGTSTPAAHHLFPPPIGAIPIDGDLPEAFAWHQAAARKASGAACPCQTIAAAHRAKVRGAFSLESVRAWMLGRGPRPGLPAGVRQGASGPALPDGSALHAATSQVRSDVLTGLLDGDVALAPGFPAAPPGFGWVAFEYGEASFRVERDWLEDYVTNDRATDDETAMDVLWARFEARATLSHNDAMALLRCWNIGSSHRDGYTWNAFWPEGGPARYYSTAVRMAHAYHKYARDDGSGTAWCTGLKTFLRDALEGEEVRDLRERPCDVRIFVKTLDERFADDASQGCMSEKDEAPLTPCSTGWTSAANPEPCGSDYDDWTPRWDLLDAGVLGPRWKARVGMESLDSPDDSCNSAAAGGDFNVKLLATRIAFRGFVADYLMYWARVALDYGLEKGSWTHLEQASLIARFVLGTALYQAHTLVHELAHVFNDTGGHCNAGCCMYVAADALACAVRADLGIPQGPSYNQAFILNSLDDSILVVDRGCDGTAAHQQSVCWIREPGEPDQLDDSDHAFGASVTIVDEEACA